MIIPFMAFILLFSACGEEEASGEPVVVVVDTQDSATRSEAGTTGELLTTSEETTPSTEEASTQTATTKAAAATVPQTTAKPVQDNIPADTIQSGNVNPYLSRIQSIIMDEIHALAVTKLTISRGSVILDEGEIIGLDVKIEPSDAANKHLTVETDNDACVKAEYRNGVLTLTAKKAGKCTVTLTSHNGLHVSCSVTVNEPEKTDPMEETTGVPTTKSAAEPTEKP